MIWSQIEEQQSKIAICISVLTDIETFLKCMFTINTYVGHFSTVATVVAYQESMSLREVKCNHQTRMICSSL